MTCSGFVRECPWLSVSKERNGSIFFFISSIRKIANECLGKHFCFQLSSPLPHPMKSIAIHTRTVFLAATAAAGAIFAATLLWRRSEKRYEELEDGGFMTHRLLDFESMLHARDEPPISTLTWFKGDYRKAAPQLERRVKLILEKNPWLGGRGSSWPSDCR